MSAGPRGTTRYAVQLLVLLALAAFASYSTVAYLEFHPDLRHAQGARSIVGLMVLVLCMGFLFLAGALGLWGLHCAAEVESRRRIGAWVDQMDFVSDGVVVVDRKGRVAGSNPAARFMAGREGMKRESLRVLFPCLDARDLAVLTDPARPREVERRAGHGAAARMLRFRSEPVQGVNQVLVCDVTERTAKDLRERQAAQLELIGRLARGVAYDLNTLLCAIAGHAALLQKRVEPGARASVEAILGESERGAAMARQLVELAHVGSDGRQTTDLAQHLERAAELLRAGLPASWTVTTALDGPLPVVPVSGRQVEQLLTNLGLLLANEQGPTEIQLGAAVPTRPGPYAVTLLVWAGRINALGQAAHMDLDSASRGDDGGIILSVIRATLEEAGGRLDWWRSNEGGRVFSLCLPHGGGAGGDVEDLAGVPQELAPYLARWSVLVAGSGTSAMNEVVRRMHALGMTVECVDDQVGVLAHVEDHRRAFASVMLGADMLGTEMEGTLRAIRKLQPTAGLVLLNASHEQLPASLKNEVVVRPGSATADEIFEAAIKARELAALLPAA